MAYVGRNDALRFARLARHNLDHMERAFQSGQDVHVVTQLVLSLLGLVVLPWEKNYVESIRGQTMATLAKKGWPQWEVTLGEAKTLGELLRHLRNATAHGRITFSSDSRVLREVTIGVEDQKSDATPVYWRATINAEDLRDFCLNVMKLIEDTIG